MSGPRVKAIDKQSVHQICSGQVVVTLATAVKELVENSLDAGASNIEVRLKNWGVDSLEVVDNGSGVLPENLAALALKHHTSKLNVFADLVGVETFGFRGEALSSLCALGNLCITTCHKSQNIGARIEYNHDGHITKQETTARTHGTTVTLQNLFSTLPVRHKEFLRNIKREYTKMMQVLQGYCVISTGVRISCHATGEKGKKTVALATHGNSDMRENISNVFGPKQLQTILEFQQINPSAEDCEELGLEASQIESNSVFSLTGFVSRCDHGAGRSASDRQYIYVNKRPCDMPKLTRLVNEVYHMFNRNQYPFLVLHIDLSKDLVDVNVTPDKRQVFLQQEKLLLATVKSSLKAMYDPGSSNYETNQKPFTQIKLALTKRKNEETNATAFSKSIKDRLLLAAKVSRNKEASSILKFTTKKPNDVSRSVDDELNGGTSTVNVVDVTGPESSNETKLNSEALFSKSELNISNFNRIRDAITSTRSTEVTPDSEALATSKDRSELVDGEVAAEVKQDSFSRETIQSASSAGASAGDGHLPINPNEYDLTSTDEAYSQEVTADKLCSEKCENDCMNGAITSLHARCTESPAKNGNVLDFHLSCSPKQNILRSLETPIAEGHPQRQLAAKDTKQSEGKLYDVQKLEDVVDSGTLNRILNVENSNESFNAYSTKTLELKRRRISENESSENSSNAKKIRVDDGYENEMERSSRKSIAVNIDLQKLRETLATESGSGDRGAEDNSSKYSRTFRATIAPENNQRAEEELERHITKEMFSKMGIIGQFNQGFIITKHEDDLFIIDQHASDEKYNFEDQQRNTVLKSQRLICPQSLDLTAVNENILMENLEVFKKNGFDFEINEEAPVSQRIKLVSSPVSRNWSFGKSDIDELIFMLSDSPGVNYRPSNIRKMFASRACRKSVMVGTSLNDGQMRRIVGHMGEMDHPWNCPHGRPTMRHLINLNMVRK